MPRPPRGCGLLYLPTLLGEVEVSLLIVEAVGLTDHEGLASRAGRSLVVVDELVAGGIVTELGRTGSVLLERIRPSEARAVRFLCDARHRANQTLRSAVADELQVAVHVLLELPLYGIGPADLAHVDHAICEAITVDRLVPAHEKVGDVEALLNRGRGIVVAVPSLRGRDGAGAGARDGHGGARDRAGTI